MKKIIILILIVGCSEKESPLENIDNIDAPYEFNVLSDDGSFRIYNKDPKLSLKEFNDIIKLENLHLADYVDDSVTLLGKSDVSDITSLLFVAYGNTIHAYTMNNDQLTSSLKLSSISDPYSHTTSLYRDDHTILIEEDYECVQNINEYKIEALNFVNISNESIDKDCDDLEEDSDYSP